MKHGKTYTPNIKPRLMKEERSRTIEEVVGQSRVQAFIKQTPDDQRPRQNSQILRQAYTEMNTSQISPDITARKYNSLKSHKNSVEIRKENASSPLKGSIKMSKIAPRKKQLFADNKQEYQA